MTARKLVSLVTLMAFVGVFIVAPLNVAQAQVAPPPHSRTTSIIDLALEVTGAVVGGLLGSHFGLIGTVIGGGLGFIVTKWISENFFPHYGSLQFNDPFTGRPPGFLGPPTRGPGWNASCTRPDDSNIVALRNAFYSAMESYKAALANGTDADKAAARTAYDSARQAYFQAKYGTSGN